MEIFELCANRTTERVLMRLLNKSMFFEMNFNGHFPSVSCYFYLSVCSESEREFSYTKCFPLNTCNESSYRMY